MSVAEIITELPKLTPADLRMVRRKLNEICEESPEMPSPLEGAGKLDRMEALSLLQGRLDLDVNKVGAWQTAVREARR